MTEEIVRIVREIPDTHQIIINGMSTKDMLDELEKAYESLGKVIKMWRAVECRNNRTRLV